MRIFKYFSDKSVKAAVGDVMFNGTECYRRYINGDEHAFDELMDAYHDGLILFINKQYLMIKI